MKKIVNFIIEKRFLMLTLFILCAIFCVFLSSKVNINYDIANYLPKSSNVKKGLDIMNSEFISDSSSFYIMFDDLDDDEKLKTFYEIKDIENVSDVNYDDSSAYNVDNHTLYKVIVSDDADSKIASDTYNEIVNKYKDKKIETSGEISERNTDVLPKYVLVAAVSFGTIILIIMCDSVVEVFLFLFTILIAVLLNKGTNIFFSSVSNITDSISAILQLALSMDYSIMLMNRFNQEKERKKDIVSAMKDALYSSFSSVSSSSITTVVGLLALVFMSFTIGRDLGFVLAKGVICSLVSTFFVLPGLIIIFDKAINKTKKRVPAIKLDRLSKFSYSFRFILLGLFILMFVGSYFLKGNLSIIFLENSKDNISSIFNFENEIAVIYNNNDEESIKDVCNSLESNEQLTSVLCYSNTINENLVYSDMNGKFKDLGTDTSIDDYLLKLIYYKYYTNGDNRVDFNSLINFINGVVYKNEDYFIDQEIKSDIEILSYFTDKDSVSKNRSVTEISQIMNIDSSLLEQLMILYNSTDSNYKISLRNFVIFMNDSIINNGDYNIPIDIANKVKTLYSIINNLDNKITSNDISSFLGIDKSSVDKVIMYYLNNGSIDTKLTINEFTGIIISSYDSYKDKFNDDDLRNIILLNKFSNSDFINSNLSSSELSTIYDIDLSIVSYILSSAGEDEVTPLEFNQLLLDSGLVTDENFIYKLNLLKSIMDNSNSMFDYSEISSFINVDESISKLVYVLHDCDDYKISLRDFINVIVNNNLIDNDNITEMYFFINNLDNWYSSNEVCSLLGVDNSNVKLIYGLYSYNNGNNKISFSNLIDFICDNVLSDINYSSMFSMDSKNRLLGIQRVINSVQGNIKLTSDEMIEVLSMINKDVSSSMIKILYMYYGSYYEYDSDWTMTVESLVDYLNNDVLIDSMFNDYIEDDMRDKIVNAQNDIIDAKKLLVGNNYSRMIITSRMDEEGEDIKSFVNTLKDNLNGTDSYVIGNSPMAIEMDQDFDKELNLITVLTMIFIFVVVAVTFKSNLISIALVLTIQCSVFTTMGILSLLGTDVYFISLLIVQAVLMGATIDYAIVYTTYYREFRKKFDIKESMLNAYNKSIHTIVTSSLILCSCTLVVAFLTDAASSKICETIAEGTFCSTVLIVLILPGVLAAIDRFIKKK